jgi:hypothetical protein
MGQTWQSALFDRCKMLNEWLLASGRGEEENHLRWLSLVTHIHFI